MQELYNQVQSATDPLEIINLSDKFLDMYLIGYIKLMFLKGEALLSLGRLDDALSVFKQILEYDVDSFAGRAHNSIGFCYSRKNEYDKSISEFEKAREYSDEQSLLLNSAIINLTAFYSMTNQKQNTFKIFKELYDLDSSNGPDDTHILILALANNPEELIGIYDSSIDERYTPDVNVLFAKGDALVTLERFDEAIPVFEKILKYRNNSDREIAGKTYTAIGICYFRKNELDKALPEFEKAREYSDDPIILSNLANTYTLTNQKQKALEVYKELYKKEPHNQDLKKIIELLEVELNGKDSLKNSPFNTIQEAFIQADIYSQRREYGKAIEVYDLITDIMPEQPPAWNKKGYAYYQLGRTEEAIKCFDKALQYNPNSAYSMFYKSLVYMGLEDYENAQDMIVQALNILPDNSEFLNNYCVILIRLGRNEEAIDIANKALIIEPDSVETYTNKAFALENLNRFEEAIECYDKALKINPNFFEAWHNKAYSFENLNMLDEAIECYEKALELSPNNSQILSNIAMLYVKKGDFDKASETLNRQ